jgi:hypothetical protein
MLSSLTALVALYFSLGSIALWLVFTRWLRRRASSRTLLWTQRLGIAASVGFVAVAVVAAARTVTNDIVVPQNTELRLLRNKVAALPPDVPRIGYVVIGSNQGFTDRPVTDEFVPTSSQPWVGEPAVILTLRDQGRLKADSAIPVVDSFPFDPTAFRVKEPLVDLRDLQQQR